MEKITLVGCGQIGSRHLQSIAKLEKSLLINIVEPDNRARQVAKRRLNDISKNLKHKVIWYKDIKELKETSDVTIVSTYSSNRVKLVTKLLQMGHSRFLLEKPVCQSIEEYDFLKKQIKKYHAKMWVNVPRRYTKSYEDLKRNQKENPSQIYIIGGNFGLGSNIIHFIDLFSWFVNDYKVKINGNLLIDKILPNKRGKEFTEFIGTVTGNSSNKSKLIITSLPYDNIPILVNIIYEKYCLVIDETNNKISYINNKESVKKKLKFQMGLVSDTTGKIINDILKKDECKLPSVQNLSDSHSEIFKIFNKHIYKITGIQKILCPIT